VKELGGRPEDRMREEDGERLTTDSGSFFGPSLRKATKSCTLMECDSIKNEKKGLAGGKDQGKGGGWGGIKREMVGSYRQESFGASNRGV